MERIALYAVAGATLAAGWMIAQRNAGEGSPLQELSDMVDRTLQRWRPPAQYAGLIAAAEDRNGIPRDVLARLLWQESRYRPEIIDGRVRSPVGALGIAQFMPATAAEWNVDPLDPASAIDGAARYLAWLRARVTSWSEALAAYNWGIGNVQRKGLQAAPQETRTYFSTILADVNTANGSNLA